MTSPSRTNFAFRFHVLHYGSPDERELLWCAVGFASCLVATMLLVCIRSAKQISGLQYYVPDTAAKQWRRRSLCGALALLLLGGCLWLNVYFR